MNHHGDGYFIHNWPNLYLLWAVSINYKKRSTGSTLIKKAIEAMVENDADEVVLEMVITNKPSLELYDPIRKCMETEDVNHMMRLTAHTPANPHDESDRIGSHTRETKYATKNTKVFWDRKHKEIEHEKITSKNIGARQYKGEAKAGRDHAYDKQHHNHQL